jgi:hypothetical protein
MDEQLRQKHKDMISDPDKWPRWPFLPLKRILPDLNPPRNFVFGIVFDGERGSDQAGFTVRFANIFHMPQTLEEYQQLNYCFYRDADALIDDGWVVD